MATNTYSRTGRDARLDQDTGRYGTRRSFTETKEFYKTSEFIVWLVGVAAVLAITYLADGRDSLTSWHGWLLVTVMSTAYMLSRGIAKSGSPEPYREDFDRYERAV